MVLNSGANPNEVTYEGLYDSQILHLFSNVTKKIKNGRFFLSGRTFTEIFAEC